jgi:hypothetical protein
MMVRFRVGKYAGMSRRDFVGTLTGSAALWALGRFPFAYAGFAADKVPGKKEFFLICHPYGDHLPPVSADRYLNSSPGELRVWSQDWAHPKVVPLPFLGHSVLTHPVRPDWVVAFERWGPYAAVVDIHTLAVVRLIKLPLGRRFFGHGCFSPDGHRLFASQMDDLQQQGIISVLNSDSFEEIGRFNSGGLFPHECRISLDKRSLMVANLSPPGSRMVPGSDGVPHPSVLSWIDLDTSRVTKTISMGNPAAVFGHFAMSEDGFIAIGGRAQKGPSPLYLIDPTGALMPFEVPKEERHFFRGEIVNLIFEAEKSLLYTALQPNVGRQGSVAAWNYKKRTFEKSVHLGAPQAMLETSNGLLVSDAADGSYKTIQTSAISEWKVQVIGPSSSRGVHMARVWI